MALVVGVSCGFVAVAPTADPAGGNLGVCGYQLGMKCMVPADATKIVELGWFVDAAHTVDVDCEIGVHAHDAGNDVPAALIAKSGPTGAGGSAQTWERSTVDISVTGGSTVWLTLEVDHPGGTPALRSNYSVVSGQRRVRSVNGAETQLTDPFPAATASADQVMAIYALYATASASPVAVLSYLNRRRRN